MFDNSPNPVLAFSFENTFLVFPENPEISGNNLK